MNIKITHNWLKEYLDTEADPYEVQKYVSLSGPSIERIEQHENDYVYDIEIISNRIDTACVAGIAQECVAILPERGIAARMKKNPLTDYHFQQITLPAEPRFVLHPLIDEKLCSRFAVIVFDKITISESPDFIKNRLRLCGISVINNVVDISNYLMLTMGQPVHIFDYDKLPGGEMKLRASKKGEKVRLLDNRIISIPEGSIVIEDGEGDITDLCGIMGGQKSAVNRDTKKIVLFVQTYDRKRIRKTVMESGVRTLAATYFEKGLDEERVEPTLVYGAFLIQKYAKGSIASKLYDLYTLRASPKKIITTYSYFEKKIGLSVKPEKIKTILLSLGFEVLGKDNVLEAVVPAHRKYDVSLPEDLVEEVARVLGYDKIPSRLSPPAQVAQQAFFENVFRYGVKAKYALKHAKFHEAINYSMVSRDVLKQWKLKESDFLRLSNPISEELIYMRTSLLPSLYINLKNNAGKKDELRFFELSKVFIPQKGDLPEEKYRLGLSVNTDYFDLKGAIEYIAKEFHVNGVDITKGILDKRYLPYFDSNVCATGFINNHPFAYFGRASIDQEVFFCEIDFEALIRSARLLAPYTPINPYAVIKLDLTIDLKKPFVEIKKKMIQASFLLEKIEMVTMYKNNLTVRLYFSSRGRNITEEEAKRELEKIKKALQIKS